MRARLVFLLSQLRDRGGSPLVAATVAAALAALPAAAAGWGERGDHLRESTGPLRQVVQHDESVQDPVGDTFGTGVQIDITSMTAESGGSKVTFSFTFANNISPGDSPAANAVVGFIDIDDDQKTSTGEPPIVSTVDGDDHGLGMDFFIDLSTYSSATGQATMFDEDGLFVARVDVTYGERSLVVVAPINVISASVNAVATLGTVSEPTDIVPNQGFIASGNRSVRLNGERFLVTMRWMDFFGNDGPGRVVPFGSDDSALFWFFDENNWEVLIKVLDGCSVNDHFWVFFAATTNVGFTITVTDTATGEVREYTNPLGQPANAVTDTAAFATCP